MNKLILVLFVAVPLGISLPTTYDIRYQPRNAIFANFQTSSDYICQSYTWGKQLSQILSNSVSIDPKNKDKKIILSTQNLAQCISGQNDMCKQTVLQNILKAIKLIQDQGLAEEECYKNKLFELPSHFCRKNCTDGQSIIRKFKARINNYTHSQVGQLLQSVGNGQTFGFVVLKYYDSMNYYSPQNSQMKAEGDFYTYRIAQIVGWRKGGAQINLRIGSSGWGYKGYGFVAVNNPIIIQFYSISTLDFQHIAQQ